MPIAGATVRHEKGGSMHIRFLVIASLLLLVFSVSLRADTTGFEVLCVQKDDKGEVKRTYHFYEHKEIKVSNKPLWILRYQDKETKKERDKEFKWIHLPIRFKQPVLEEGVVTLDYNSPSTGATINLKTDGKKSALNVNVAEGVEVNDSDYEIEFDFRAEHMNTKGPEKRL